MNIGGVQTTVHAFASRLNTMKLHQPSIGWYNFPTLSVFTILDRLLAGPHRDLRYIISSQPVLDLGCGDGDLTLLLSHLGFDVDAVDNPGTNANRMEGVRYLTQLVSSPAQVHERDLDRLAALPRPRYGLGIFLGVLYHLKNPFHALEQLAATCEYVLISTRVVDGAQPTAYLVEPGELNADPTNYWLLTPTALTRLLKRAGLEPIATTREGATGDADAGLRDGRMYVLAKTKLASPVRLLDGWHAEEPTGFRWTARRFSFAGPPASRFRLKFVSTLDAITLSGPGLPTQTFKGAGEHTYEAGLPGGGVAIELDRAFTPPPPDRRQLGIAVACDGGISLSGSPCGGT